ncbi:MAG: hypothetical protein KDB52_06690 [Solirubrobacterales bacterium]|nr:hypothetical protein [Solirubrobacterales bacterium]
MRRKLQVVAGYSILALLGLIANVGSATAEEYYAAPDSVRMAAPCASEDPCRIDTALTVATLGDEVILKPGSYFEACCDDPWTSLPDLADGVVLRAEDPTEPPVLFGEVLNNADPFLALGDGATMRDIEVRMTGSNVGISYGVQTGPGSVIDRSAIRMTGVAGGFAAACMPVNTTIRNSACLGDGSGRVDAVSSTITGGNFSSRLINVTAITTSSTGVGARVGISSAHSSVFNISNSIMRGPTADLGTGTFAGMPPRGAATINVEYSNWNTYQATGNGTNMLIPDAGNQSGPTAASPLFRNAAEGNFRQVAGSPTIDAGLALANADPLAPGGTTRLIGSAPDIGAYEFAPPPQMTLGEVSEISQTSAVLNAVVDPQGSPTRVEFLIGKPGDVPAAIEAGKVPGAEGSVPVNAAAQGLEPATTYLVSGRVSSPDGGSFQTDPIEFETRAVPGPPDGGSPRPKLKKIAIAPRWRLAKGTAIRLRTTGADRVRLRFMRKRGRHFRKVGTLTVRVRDGLTRRRFKGKLPKRKLKPGRYRLVAVAISDEGRKSRPRTVRFRLMR